MYTNVLNWLENTCEKFSDKVAYCDKDNSYSFGDVLDQAKRVGTFLALNVKDKRPIAVISGRKIQTITTYLGVVYSGHVYAPIDAKLPVNRISTILETLNPSAIIADEDNFDLAKSVAVGTTVYTFEDSVNTQINNEKLEEIKNTSAITDPLYIIFTSGSTGKPKGVITSHLSLMNYIESFTQVMGIDENDMLGNQSPLDYIAAIRDIYIPLLTGCSTLIIPKEFFMQPNELFKFMNKHKVSSIGWCVSAFTVLSALGAFKEEKLEYLNKVCFSGSIMPGKCLKEWQKNLPNALFVNQYGPTEATASCTYYVVESKVEDDTVLPIGKPYNNYKVFLLSEDDTLTPIGQEGEICIGGPTLALGYYNDPQRTAASFIQNPVNKAYNELIYKSGDIGVMRSDGVLEFHGRKDRQIKHLGHRVELDEIELAASSIANVDECSVIYNHEKEVIWLFYVGTATVKELAVELKKSLPTFMLPRKIKNIDEIPKLPNGKIDMNTLKQATK